MNEMPNHTNGHRANGKGFGRPMRLMAASVVTAIVAQNLTLYLPEWTGTEAAGSLGAALVIGLFLYLFRSYWRTLTSPYFAVSLLLAIAAGTILGTFVTQNTVPEVFTQRYGEGGSAVLRFLHMEDLFHSWWYVSFFVLLCLSLMKLSARRTFNASNLGFHLAHLSPVIIIAGFWIDFFLGFRGIIQLEEGQNKNIVQLYRGHTNYLAGTREIPFDIRLDDFEYEKFEPDYRIQLWERDATVQSVANPHGGMEDRAVPRIVTTFPLEHKKIRHVYGTDYNFWVTDFYPNFQFEYSYPDNIDTLKVIDPGLMMNLKTAVGETTLQFRSDHEGRNKLADPNVGATLEFYWTEPIDGQVAEGEDLFEDRIIIVGETRRIHFDVGGDTDTRPLELNTYYPVPGKEDVGFTIQHLMPDVSHLVATPASIDDQLENPVAKVEFWDTKTRQPNEIYLYPNRNRTGGIYQLPGTKYFLALESIRDMETRFYRSALSVMEGDEVVKQQSIIVNEPMLHRGFRFYQSDYDPNNPSYSGIGVSHEPGLSIIYFGFVCLVAGCLTMFFVNNRNG